MNRDIAYTKIVQVGVCVNSNTTNNRENQKRFLFVKLSNDLNKKRMDKYPKLRENRFAYRPPYMPIKR